MQPQLVVVRVDLDLREARDLRTVGLGEVLCDLPCDLVEDFLLLLDGDHRGVGDSVRPRAATFRGWVDAFADVEEANGTEAISAAAESASAGWRSRLTEPFTSVLSVDLL